MKKIRIIAGASAAVLALGLLTACGQKQEPVEETPVVQEEVQQEAAPAPQPEVPAVEEFPLERVEEETDEELSSETADVIVAELTEIAEDGTLIILPYTPVEEKPVNDADVDFSAFAAGDETQTLIPDENVLFQKVQEGELTEADAGALSVGAMLVITTEADGMQTIVIHEPVEEIAE